jgi:putative ABC transport system substrate-binding protein
MRLIGLAVFLALNLILMPFAAEAQQAGKVYRIGALTLGLARVTSPVEAFLQELREHGYVEGQNMALEFRFAENRIERLPALAAELVRLAADKDWAAITAPVQRRGA